MYHSNDCLIQVYRYSAFVHCKEILENGGIVVVKCAHLNLLGGAGKKMGASLVPLAPRVPSSSVLVLSFLSFLLSLFYLFFSPPSSTLVS